MKERLEDLRVGEWQTEGGLGAERPRRRGEERLGWRSKTNSRSKAERVKGPFFLDHVFVNPGHQ